MGIMYNRNRSEADKLLSRYLDDYLLSDKDKEDIIASDTVKEVDRTKKELEKEEKINE